MTTSQHRRLSTLKGRTQLWREGRRFTDLLFTGKPLDRETCLLLKRTDIALLSHILGQSAFRRHRIKGHLFPTNPKDLDRRIPTHCTDEFNSEANWSAAVFASHAVDLNEQLVLSRECVRALLLGDYGSTNQFLQKIRETYGISLWWLKISLLHADMSIGLEGNRQVRKDLADDVPNSVLFFLHFFSLQSEATVSAEDYTDTVNALLSPDTLSDIWATYYGYRLGCRFDPPLDAMSYILNFEECHSLLDRYFVWSDLVRLYISSSQQMTSASIAEAVFLVASSVSDARTDFLASILDPSTVFRNPLFSFVYELLDLYTTGQYEESFILGCRLLQSFPDCFELYELTAKSSLHCASDCLPAANDGALANTIYLAIRQVLQRTAGTQDSLRMLRRLACRLHPLALSPAITAFVQQHLTDELPLRLDRQTAMSGMIPTPRVYASSDDTEQLLKDLTLVQKACGKNAAVNLYIADNTSIRSGRLQDSYPAIPEMRKLRHQAFVEERLGDYQSALLSYKTMTSHTDRDTVYYGESRAGTLRCLMQLGSLHEALEILADSCTVQPHLISADTLRRILLQYNVDNNITGVGDVAWPIVMLTAQVTGAEPANPDRLHDFLDDFLTAYDCRRPSDLLAHIDQFKTSQVVKLFRDVCTTPVLQSSIWYDSQDEVETERIRLCRWLAENDKPNASTYLDEIADLSHRSAVRDLIREADRSRVFVDTNGIEKALPEVTRERAFRCASLFLLRDDNLRKCLDIAGLDLASLGKSKVVFLDEGFKLFKTIFFDLREAFLGSTQYGLDANLSQRIRHGTLAGEIRSHFESHHLVTYVDASGSYSQPSHWLHRIASLSEGEKASLYDAVCNLSMATDNTIALVRNEWIQIRSENGPTGALFDFEFNEADLISAYSSMKLSASEEGESDITPVFQAVFNALWERTEVNLCNVRQAIMETLRDRLFSQLDDFESSLQSIDAAKTAEIRMSIANCRTSVGNGLQTMSEWFRSGVKQRVPDSQIEHLAVALSGVVANYCGPSHVACSVEVEPNIVVPGYAFRGVWDILFLLLDNAAKHSGGPMTNVLLKVTRDVGSLEIFVSNSVDESIGMEDLRRTADQLSNLHRLPSNLEAARKEGGSGHTKLRKILQYDLHCSHYKIAASVGSNRTFVVQVTMNPEWCGDEATSS